MRTTMALALLAGVCLWCAASPAGQSKPAWVDTPSSAYPETLYVSAVGGGRDRASAEQSAKAALAAYFRQSVSSRITLTDSERQVDGGRINSVSEMSQLIQASAAFDDLMGVEIKAVWEEAKTGWWAAAVMEKARCRELYGAELNKNVREIRLLSDISGGVSFDSLKRCREAEALLSRAEVLTLVLHSLDGPDRRLEMSRLRAAVSESLSAVQAVPVDVRVTGDVEGRIRAAFAKVFTDAGFRVGSVNSRCAVRVKFSLEPLSRGEFYNSRYTVDAVLLDTQTGAELLPWNSANRAAHPKSQSEADNRAVIDAVRAITGDFSLALQRRLEEGK